MNTAPRPTGFFLLALLFILSIMGLRAQNTPITIMPMGDSITAGTDYYTLSASGYRDPLYRDLIAAGITNFTFVGNNNGSYGNSRTLVDANEFASNGFGGDYITDLYNGLISSAAPTDGGSGPNGGFWLDTIKPTFILLQAGTNDVHNNQTLSQMQASMNQLIAEIHLKSPQSIVFVAGIPPFSLATGPNPQIYSYDAWLKNTLVPNNTFTRYVDNNSAFYIGAVNSGSGTVNTALLGYDNGVGIHPTRYGYPILGVNWAAAIESYLGVTPTVFSVTVTNGNINDGASTGSYPAGTVITLVSNAPSGNQFGGWTGSTAQATTALNNPYSAVTTYVVPAANSTVTANYVATGSPLIPNGTYNIVGSADSYQSDYSYGPYGTTVAASGSTSGSSVVGQLYTATTTQQWVLKNLQTSNGNNQVELSLPGTSNTIAMGVAGSTAAGSALDVETFTNATSQQWVPTEILGTVELVNVNSGLAVTDGNIGSGQPFEQGTTGDLSGNNPIFPVGYSASQYFTLYPVTGAAPPAAPTGLSATAGSGQVTLSWTGVSGATSYNIYRGTTTTGLINMAIVATNVTTTSYTDKALVGPPPIPQNLIATGGSGQVSLTWTSGTTTPYYYEVVAVNANGSSNGSNDATASPTGGAAVTGYTVYRSTSPYSELNNPPIATSATASFTDTTVTAGTAYYYVIASDSITGISSTGNQSSATPTAGGGSAPSITSATTATGTVGSAFTYQITASNSPTGYSASGLPAGLAVNTSTGAITGTPSAAGTSSVTIGATNSVGTGTAILTLTVSAASGSKPVITSSGSTTGTVGSAFTYQIVATNTPTSYSASGLPTGLSVNTSTGAITGTPSAAGTTSATISATNVNGTGTATLSITISAAPGNPPVISSPTSASGTVGSAFTYQIAASNSPASFNATGLPAGLSVSTTTGVISGTPTAAATTAVTISATNANGTGSATLTLTVSASGLTFSTPSGVTAGATGLNDSVYHGVGEPPLTGFAAPGDSNITAVDTYAAGNTPAYVFLNTATGFNYTGGSTVSAYLGTDAAGSAASDTTANNGVVYDAIGYINVPAAMVNKPYTFAMPTADDAGRVLIGGNGTPGTGTIVVEQNFGGTTLTVASTQTVTFTQAGLYPIEVLTYQDVGGAGFHFTVTGGAFTYNIAGTGGAKPAITSSLSATGTVGTAFSYQITASNSPTSYSATGLPAGLTVNATTGAITGTPSAAGTTSVTIGATNASGTGTATLSITIAAAGSPPAITSALSATGIVGSAFTYQITASNSPTSYNATGLPTGLSVSTTTGAISGTPTATGTSSVTISATNSFGTGSATLSLTVSSSAGGLTFTTPSGVSAGAIGLNDSVYHGVGEPPLTGFAAPSDSNITAVDTYASRNTPAYVFLNTATGFNYTGGSTVSAYLGTDAAGSAASDTTANNGVVYDAIGYINVPAAMVNKPYTFSMPTADDAGRVLIGGNGTPGTGTIVVEQNFGGTTLTVASTQTVTFTQAGLYPIEVLTYQDVGGAGFHFTVTGGAFTYNIAGTGGAKPAITSSLSATGTVGTAFNYQITASNSPTSYSATGLPAGLTVNTTSGAIVGTPSAAGTSSVTIGATNASGTGTATLSITIAAANNPPAITSALTASGTVSTAFSYQITASNSPTSYSASGLPTGLTVNTTTGAITGTPAAAGTSSITIGATNANGTGTATLALTVSAAGAQQSIAFQFVGGGTAMAAADSAGVPAVAQTNWKAVTGASFVNVALTSNTGAATTAVLNGAADGTYFCGSSFSSGSGDAKLCSGELFDGNINTETNSMTVSAIPYAKYDVYIYGECDAGTRGATFTVTAGGTSSSLSFQTESNGSTWTAGTNTWNGSGTAPTLAVGNYVHFTGLTATSFTVKFGGVNNVGMNGIQIVKTP